MTDQTDPAQPETKTTAASPAPPTPDGLDSTTWAVAWQAAYAAGAKARPPRGHVTFDPLPPLRVVMEYDGDLDSQWLANQMVEVVDALSLIDEWSKSDEPTRAVVMTHKILFPPRTEPARQQGQQQPAQPQQRRQGNKPQQPATGLGCDGACNPEGAPIPVVKSKRSKDDDVYMHKIEGNMRLRGQNGQELKWHTLYERECVQLAS